jgi:integrase/recombinase XerD
VSARRGGGGGGRDDGLLDPRGFLALSRRYHEWMRVTHYAESTVETSERLVGYFLRWCAEREVHRPTEVTRQLLERYKRHLYYHRKTDGAPLTVASQKDRLSVVRRFFSWLARNDHLLYNPASEIDLPKSPKHLPRAVLSVEEAEAVLAGPDLSDPLGLRDRAILETLYSTGLRRAELAALTLKDLDRSRRTVLVREGKGKKDRMVPIGERACRWVERYLEEARPQLAVSPDDGTLFLAKSGRALGPNHLSFVVGAYVRSAGIDKAGACHLFRHTMATLMLEGGADIRFIQQMLGHEQLTTTQLYTRVSIQELQKVHTRTHPARMERRGRDDEGDEEGGEPTTKRRT